MAKNLYDIVVGGITFKIVTDEDEAYVNELVETIDSDLNAILEDNNIPIMNALILCALDYLDKHEKARKGSANMRNQIKEYLTDAATSKLLLEEQSKRNEELSEEVRTLRAKMSTMVEPETAEEASRKAEKINKALAEIQELRKINDDAVKQCRALNDRINALNDYNAKQGNEVSELKNKLNEQANQLGAKDNTIAELKNQIKNYQREAAQLHSQLEARPSQPENRNQHSDDDFEMPNLSWTDQI